MTADDQILKLIEKAKAGDQDAFEKIVKSYRGRVEQFIRSRLGAVLKQAESTSDILQETFLSAFKSLDHFCWQGEASFSHWLQTIADNVLRTAARRQKRRPVSALKDDIASETASWSTPLRRDERFDRLQNALSTLDPDSRRVVILARIEGLSIKEVAKRIGRSPNATSILLYRAFVKLREHIGDTESLSLPFRSLGNADEQHDEE